MAAADAPWRSPRARLWQDGIFTTVAWGAGLLGFMLPLSIVAFLLYRGAAAITLVIIGLAVSLPLAVGGAIYLTEYGASDRLRRAASFCGECLAGVPAIVYGLFGYSFLVVFLGMRTSLLAGGITLGLVMLPIILIGAYEALRAVEAKYREAALVLGVSRLYALRKNVWPKGRAGHAFGSAAPVLLTASVVISQSGLDLASPVMTLPSHLYYLVSEASSLEQAYATALILVAILLTANFSVMLIRSRQER